MTLDPQKCKHQPVYFGVVNINIDERTIGSVDVWRCTVCKTRFCEEKQLGIEAIADIVGMPPIGLDEKWAVSICKLQKGKEKWKLIKVKENFEFKHECLDEHIVSIKVEDFQIKDDNHWSFLIDENVNRAIEI